MIIRVLLLIALVTTYGHAAQRTLATKELNELASMLDTALWSAQKHNSVMASRQIVVEIRDRLTEFKDKFGLVPSSKTRYKQFERTAKKLLPYFQPFPSDLDMLLITQEQARLHLHELSGNWRQYEIELRFYESHDGCGTAAAMTGQHVSSLLIALYTRLGFTHKATLAFEDYSRHSDIFKGSPSDSLNDLTYRLFYYKRSNTTDAIPDLQRLVDLHPGTLAAHDAEKILATNGALKQPNPVRLKKYLSSEFNKYAVLALGEHKFKKSLEVLTSELKRCKRNQRRYFFKAFVTLDDKRAIPIIENYVVNPYKDNKLYSTLALVQLGAIQYIPHLMKVWSYPRYTYFTNIELHLRLKENIPYWSKVQTQRTTRH